MFMEDLLSDRMDKVLQQGTKLENIQSLVIRQTYNSTRWEESLLYSRSTHPHQDRVSSNFLPKGACTQLTRKIIITS